jgi:anti-sigma regulatory factor (Ser/Thr protein kinase)
MCQHATVRLPCSLSSVRAARLFVADQLDLWGATTHDVAHDQVVDAVLVVSELVANAVKFSAREVELRLDVHRDHIQIAVTDDNVQRAERQQPDRQTPGGRGLVLVDALTDEWGQQWQGDNKTVWAQLPLPPGSALGRGCHLLDV